MSPTLPLHLRIFLSSPGDVPEERATVRRVLEEIGRDVPFRDLVTLRVIGWDTPGDEAVLFATMTPQASIYRSTTPPAACDIVVVIFNERMGTRLPPADGTKADGAAYRSGTEQEFLDALEAHANNGRPEVVVYRRDGLPAVRAADFPGAETEHQRRLLEEFFAEFRHADGTWKRSLNYYQSLPHFENLLRTQLKKVIYALAQRGSGPGKPPPNDEELPPVLDSPRQAQEQQLAWARRQNVDPTWTNDLGIRFKLIPPGRGHCGASAGDRAARKDEGPRRLVTFRRPFWVATFPLTNQFVRKLVTDHGGDAEIAGLLQDSMFARLARQGGGADECPAGCFNARDAEQVCGWMGRIDGRQYRLPTEAEWEYAARAGALGRFPWEEHVEPRTRAVFQASGSREPDPARANAWGLIDVLGNVEEWTASAYSPGSEARVLRGGCWNDLLEDLRLYRRRSQHPGARRESLGVRVLCEFSPGCQRAETNDGRTA